MYLVIRFVHILSIYRVNSLDSTRRVLDVVYWDLGFTLTQRIYNTIYRYVKKLKKKLDLLVSGFISEQV